jgi:protein SCO1/2
MKNWIILAFVVLLAACEKSPPELAQTTVYYPEGRTLPSFVLYDQFGGEVDNHALEGHWTWLFLGYTSCPDICPMTLAKLAAARKQVTQTDVNIWFVSVDPHRDTNEKRAAYAAYFGEGIFAITGTHDLLFPFVRSLGLIYSIGDTTQATYSVDHSASIALVAPDGKLVAIFKPDFELGKIPLVDQATLVKDFNEISAQY